MRKVNEKHNVPKQNIQKQEQINKKAHSIIDFKQKEQKQEDKGYAFRHKLEVKPTEEKQVRLHPVPQTPPLAIDTDADLEPEKPIEEAKQKEPKQEDKVDAVPHQEIKPAEEEQVLLNPVPQTPPRATDIDADLEPEKSVEEVKEEEPKQEDKVDAVPQQEIKPAEEEQFDSILFHKHNSCYRCSY